MLVEAKCNDPRSAAWPKRKLNFVSPNTFSTPCDIVLHPRPVLDDQQNTAMSGHYGPSLVAVHHILNPLADIAPVGHQCRTGNYRHCRWARRRAGLGAPTLIPPASSVPTRDLSTDRAQLRVMDHPTGADLTFPHLKLRLHQWNDIGVARRIQPAQATVANRM